MLGLPQVFTLFSALLTLSGVQAYPNPGTVNGAITGVHDPSVAKGADGAYILVSTGPFSLPALSLSSIADSFSSISQAKDSPSELLRIESSVDLFWTNLGRSEHDAL